MKPNLSMSVKALSIVCDLPYTICMVFAADSNTGFGVKPPSLYSDSTATGRHLPKAAQAKPVEGGPQCTPAPYGRKAFALQ